MDSKGCLRLFSDVWSENAALKKKKIMKINSNLPMLNYGFKGSKSHLQISLNIIKLCKDEKYTIMMMYMKSYRVEAPVSGPLRLHSE